jgi:hypothetical protein
MGNDFTAVTVHSCGRQDSSASITSRLWGSWPRDCGPCEVYHSPPSSAEVKNTWSYTYASSSIFMVWCLIKHRGNFTYFILLIVTVVSFIYSIQYKLYNFLLNWITGIKYSGTSIYRSRIICFPRSVVQFLWSLSESYLNYGSRIYCFPGSIVSFSDPRRKRWIEVSLYLYYTDVSMSLNYEHSRANMIPFYLWFI